MTCLACPCSPRRLAPQACGALAALADRVEAVLDMLLDFSVPPLIEQTLEDFATTTEGGAAVFVCGARALLTMAEDLPAGALRLTGMRLEELAFTAADVAIKGTIALSADGASYQALHTRHQATFVLTACCEIFAALARERLRVLALSANSNEQLVALLKAGHVARAARLAADALAKHPSHLGVASAALQAVTSLVQLHFVSCNAWPMGAGAGGPKAAGVPEGAISRTELQTLEKLARHTFLHTCNIPDDPFVLNLRALADRAILELERCRSGPSALSCK